MRQSERASIMRIVSDLIEADGIIDAREIIFLDSLREKYGIKKEDEVAAAPTPSTKPGNESSA